MPVYQKLCWRVIIWLARVHWDKLDTASKAEIKKIEAEIA
jgi:hypothetical protein